MSLYTWYLRKVGFQKPDATGEAGYPPWLLRLPFPMRMPVLLVLAAVGWVFKVLSGGG